MKMEWINVKERLPITEDYVLITDQIEVWIGSYGNTEFRGRKAWSQAYIGSAMVNEQNITHWQPLPKKP